MACRALAALFLLPAAATAQGFDEVVAFGDSLTDNGNLYDLTRLGLGRPIPESPPYFDGRFSNGPVWIETLTPLVGGDGARLVDFAFGGAETGTELTPPGVEAQVDGWLLRGNLPGDGTLVSLWGGANDYLGEAFTADPEGLVGRSVGNLVDSARRLGQAGAKTILVPNLPDLGVTPLARRKAESQPETPERLDALSQAHNDRLAEALDALRQEFPDTRFVLLDVASLFRDVLADPAAYGLSNVTVPCLTEVAPDPGAPTGACATPEQAASTLFFDPLHPTVAGHDLLARFGAAVLAETQAVLAAGTPNADLALGAAGAQARAVAARLTALRSGLSSLGLFSGIGIQYASLAPVGGAFHPYSLPTDPDHPFGAFALVSREWGSRADRAAVSGFDYARTLGMLGGDWRVAPGLRLGLGAGYVRGNADHAGDPGRTRTDSVEFVAYGALDRGAFRLDAALGIGLDRYDILRATGFEARPLAAAETDGVTWWADVKAGYALDRGNVRITPFLGLNLSRTRIDEYAETGAGPLNLTVEGQNARSALGSFGLALGTRGEGSGAVFRPRLDLALVHEFADDPRRFAAELGGNPLVAEAEPGDRTWATLGIGIDVDLGRDAVLSARYEGSLGRSDGQDHAILGRLRLAF